MGLQENTAPSKVALFYLICILCRLHLCALHRVNHLKKNFGHLTEFCSFDLEKW